MNEQGWDPNVKKLFRKIINSISIALLWMLACATAGIYFELAYFGAHPLYATLIFYFLMIVSLVLLIRHLYRVWKNDF